MGNVMRASVRSKVVLIASVAMLLAIAANTAFSGYFFATEYSTVVRSEAGLIGRFLRMEMEKIIGFGLPIGQVTGFDSQCQDVVDRYDIVLHAYVIDMQGKILFRSSGVEETHAIVSIVQAANDGVEVSVFQADEKKGDQYDFVLPVSSADGANVGAVVIVIPADEITAKVNSLVLFSALVAAVSFLAALALLFFALKSWVTSPLTKLSLAIKDITKSGAMKSVEVKTSDEIGELASSFNTMISDLKASQEKLKHHTEELEASVQERTRTLDQKLTELTDTKTAVLNMMEDMEKANKDLVVTKGKLEDSFGKLREVDMKKDEFISIAAHELKTPLTSIHGFSQLLRDGKIAGDVEKRNKYLEIIDHESMRLAKLVNEILDLSRIDLGTIRFAFEEVDVGALLDSVNKEMEIPVKSKGLKLEFNVSKGLPVITTDRERLTQVLINLITNSVKYTHQGKILVSVAKDGGSIRFSVKDTGIGIAKENHEKMFQRFYQVDSSYTRKAGGTGLGLSLCREFVTRLGGRIWFESALGQGSEFIFTLPLKLPEAVVQMEKDRKEAEASEMASRNKRDAAGTGAAARPGSPGDSNADAKGNTGVPAKRGAKQPAKAGDAGVKGKDAAAAAKVPAANAGTGGKPEAGVLPATGKAAGKPPAPVAVASKKGGRPKSREPKK